MKEMLFVIIGFIFVIIVLLVIKLPAILRLLGLHPDFEHVKYNLKGKRALIITTSQGFLGKGGKKTGVFASEMTIPYYEFLDNGIDVDIASIKGGIVPIEPISIRWPVITSADKKFRKDNDYLKKINESLSIDNIDFTSYDLIYLAGGWGAAYDFGQSEVLGGKISEAYRANKIIGSVCHGALGFLNAFDENQEPLLKGKLITAVTDKQINELGINKTPLHPERELRKLGVRFESRTAFKDFFANYMVVDGNIVTGQNQNAGGMVAQTMMKILSEKIGMRKYNE